MKTIHLLAIALAGIAASGCATQGAVKAGGPTKTEVVFDHPENFTDVKDSSTPTDRGRDSILSNLRGFLEERADPLLPDGYSLRIVFTDIDLAGDYEPWRGFQWSDVRVVKPIYPPAFKFTYAVTDSSGKVVRQGTEDIRDLDFQIRMAFPQSDPLRFEKDILGDWARSTLRDLRKA